jgi:hypothetical protein
MDEATEESSRSCGCGPSCGCPDEARATQELAIVWQRLLTEGTTCPRCGTTQQAVHQAVEALTEALRPLGITPVLEERALDQATFEASPEASNRIWIAGRPLEDWLGATAGASSCCSVCGDNECRTLEVDGSSFEAVPERLIIKAGLAAAASLLTV